MVVFHSQKNLGNSRLERKQSLVTFRFGLKWMMTSPEQNLSKVILFFYWAAPKLWKLVFYLLSRIVCTSFKPFGLLLPCQILHLRQTNGRFFRKLQVENNQLPWNTDSSPNFLEFFSKWKTTNMYHLNKDLGVKAIKLKLSSSHFTIY